ncbi:MAG: Eco57I restriction-modification methylase domain-containing protein [Marvinbryantia sp.]
MKKLIDITAYPIRDVLPILLQDKTTKKNIIWATETYADYGVHEKDQMTTVYLLGPDAVKIEPRIFKAETTQIKRTRSKAEVFTPAWLCNEMNNYCDSDWFGRDCVFNDGAEKHTWLVNDGRISFPEGKDWKTYADSRHLEITCGEAPFLVSRYDAASGEEILPLYRRIGILDRKIRVIDENAETKEEWGKWTERAFQSIYGYEFQGDNVLLARCNLMMTYFEYYQKRWSENPSAGMLKKMANIITWNIWQMDGLTGTVPFAKPPEDQQQISFFNEAEDEASVPCKLHDWRSKRSMYYSDLRETKMGKKLFDFVIGNPPYQEEQDSDDVVGSKKNYAPPVYNIFMDAANDIAERTELVHPARFLFNAGSTPKSWNEKMLSDEHFKVLKYEPDSNKIFPGLTTPIKGGIAITYHDNIKKFGAIGAFNQYKEVNTIAQKVIHRQDFQPLMDIVYSRTSYRLTEKMHQDHPDAINKLSKGHAYDMASNIFERLPEVFFDQRPEDGNTYIKVLGRLDNKRIYKYIRRDYVNNVDNLGYYKVLVPQANGNGTFGEPISQPVIEGPNVGNTETFISIGKFETRQEAINVGNYIRTKFARTLLSILKVTQNGNKPVWKMIPLQNFTSSSDIDWSKSVHDIDLQLYRKYGLDEDEINFIETHVKEMA